MICCALGVAAVATGAIGWKRFRRFLPRARGAQSLLAAGTAAAVVITALSVEHVRLHAAHASGLEMTSGDPLPLCRDGDRTTIASKED
jgi:multisubunit Na+/H+ antiporter MnhG subunit